MLLIFVNYLTSNYFTIAFFPPKMAIFYYFFFINLLIDLSSIYLLQTLSTLKLTIFSNFIIYQ